MLSGWRAVGNQGGYKTLSDSSSTGLMNLPLSFPTDRTVLLCLGQSGHVKLYGYNKTQYGFTFDNAPNFYTWIAIGW